MSPAGAWEGADIPELLDASGLRVAVACARFNRQVTERLLDAALVRLEDLGVDEGAVDIVWVPGAFELPLAARTLAVSGSVDAVICLGAVIRGETSHYDFVAGECAAGLQRVQLDTGVPVVFGVLTTEDLEQALARSGGKHGDKGAESAEVAIEMVNLIGRIEDRAAAVAAATEATSGWVPPT
jgi:6,7-dimethyl-8-ribityllumazine synthase